MKTAELFILREKDVLTHGNVSPLRLRLRSAGTLGVRVRLCLCLCVCACVCVPVWLCVCVRVFIQMEDMSCWTTKEAKEGLCMQQICI